MRQPAENRFLSETEIPVHTVKLAPFLISKYEMTQGQWFGFTGRIPSRFRAGLTHASEQITMRHPVESVNWMDATEVLRRLGLQLPTEAQWEYG